MNIKENEIRIKKLELEKMAMEDTTSLEYEKISKEINALKKETHQELSAWDRVYLARHVDRPKAQDYISLLFDDFYEMHGDRFFGDDGAIIGGIATFKGMPVTIIAQSKEKH